MSTTIVGTDVRRKSMAPWLKDDVEYYPHQAEAIRHLINKANFLLCDDMGLGKSLEAITIFCADILRGMAETCLVVCPVTIKENWADEFEKFTTVPAVILQGTPTQRSEKLISFRNQTGPRALIVNYEQVTAHLSELNLVRFDVAIFDEAHYIKNHKSKRTKAALDIRAHRYFMLTGTPILNNVSELWSLLHKCDPAKFRSYWTFVNRYCNTPEAPIWMADGSWKPIGKVQAGDWVMGWERENGRRCHMPAYVKEVRRRVAPQIVKVTMASGQIIRCTPDHRWLSPNNPTPGEDTWCSVGLPFNLPRSGKGPRTTSLSHVISPPPILSPELQSQADWLCGIYDGEGSNDYIAQSLSHNPKIHARIGEVLANLGVPYRVDAFGYQLQGGKQTFSNLLTWFGSNLQKSQYFHKRIMLGNHRKDDGSRGQMNRTRDKILSIELEPPGEVVSMETSTGNYVAWGYASSNCVFGGFQNKQIIGVKHEEELKNILTQYMIRRLSKDVLPLKEPIPQIKYVNLAEEQRKIYNQVRDELILVDEATGKEQDIDNALTKFLRLKQICGSTYSFTGTDVSSKLDLACEDAVQIVLGQNDRLIVFTQFRDTQHVYAQRLRKEGILVWELHGDIKQDERVGVVKEWALSKRPGVILCMLQVAGTGLNMTAARYIQFLDKLYVPGLNQQAIARANRIGQDITQAVIVMEYICRDTVESRIEAILRGKIKTVDNIVEGAAEWKRSFLEKLKEEMARERVGL